MEGLSLVQIQLSPHTHGSVRQQPSRISANFILWNTDRQQKQQQQKEPRESTAGEVSFECSHPWT